MYVSIHATTHPIEYAGFFALERQAFAHESLAALERRAHWRAPTLTVELDAAVPELIVDLDPTRFFACVA